MRASISVQYKVITVPELYTMLIVVPYHGRVTPDFLFSDTGTGTGKCKPKLPPEIGGSVARAPGIKILWPLIFRLRPHTAMADFGLPSTAPCREAQI